MHQTETVIINTKALVMCKIKTGKQVESRLDLQNLVTSIILRQRGRFIKSDLYQALEKELRNSEFHNGKEKKKIVADMCDETLKVLRLSDYVSYDRREKSYCLSVPFPAIF